MTASGTAAETAALDNAAEAGQSSRSGLIAEGEYDLAVRVAKRAGWTPKEEWKRDPAKWVDAPEYLEQTPRELTALKESRKRLAQAAEAAIEDGRRQARIDAQREIREAHRAGDEDAVVAAGERLAKVSGPPPQTVAWLARNEWFQSDPEAQALARSVIDRMAASNQPIDDQLEAAERRVRELRPDLFSRAETKPEPKDEEIKLSESRVSRPPAVQGGARGASSTPKEKGFADIPANDRGLYAKHFAKRYESRMTKAEGETLYAKSYWKNKGE